MRCRTVAMLCFILGSVITSAAQPKTVTNADLEKYKVARLTAEREYRENYERLGMPSPTELERRREHDRVETEQLSTRLRSEHLERDRLELQREARSQYFSYPQTAPRTHGYSSTYFWSYGRRYRSPQRHFTYQQPGYFAGGQFWPTGGQTPSRPLIDRLRSPRR